MIIHFLQDSIYSQACMKYINKKFDKKNHLFIILSTSKVAYISKDDNVKIYMVTSLFDSIKIVKKIYKLYIVDKVFIHRLSDIHLFPVLFCPKNIRKYWFLWGEELYSNIDWELYDSETLLFLKRKKSVLKFKKLIKNELRKYAVSKINYIGTNETEFNIIKKYFKTNAIRCEFRYPNPMDEYCSKEVGTSSLVAKNRNEKIILLGNSADPSNNHISILKKIANLPGNYKLLVPLSYGGSEEYINAVKEIGKNLLGSHFVPIIDFLEPTEWKNILSNVDVGIMNHWRQQAVGNIRSLLSDGKKVYLSEKNPLYAHYMNNDILIQSVEKCDFDVTIFDEYTNEQKERNKSAIEELYSQDKVFKFMENLFMV